MPTWSSIRPTDWSSTSGVDQTVLRFAEQFSVDVSALDESLRADLWAALGEGPREAGTTQVGTVVHQNPSGGHKVKRGSAVTLTIGRAPTTTTPGPGAGDETQTTPPPDGGAGAPGG